MSNRNQDLESADVMNDEYIKEYAEDSDDNEEFENKFNEKIDVI